MGPAESQVQDVHSQGVGLVRRHGVQDSQLAWGMELDPWSLLSLKRSPCPLGLLHVPTNVGDCAVFFSTTNFSSTSYTMYTCCKQLFAR